MSQWPQKVLRLLPQGLPPLGFLDTGVGESLAEDYRLVDQSIPALRRYHLPFLHIRPEDLPKSQGRNHPRSES